MLGFEWFLKKTFYGRPCRTNIKDIIVIRGWFEMDIMANISNLCPRYASKIFGGPWKCTFSWSSTPDKKWDSNKVLVVVVQTFSQTYLHCERFYLYCKIWRRSRDKKSFLAKRYEIHINVCYDKGKIITQTWWKLIEDCEKVWFISPKIEIKNFRCQCTFAVMPESFPRGKPPPPSRKVPPLQGKFPPGITG